MYHLELMDMFLQKFINIDKKNRIKVDKETANKYDYFSFIASIFSLKFEEKLIDIDYLVGKNDNVAQANIIIDLLTKARDKIKSKQFSDNGFKV